jgi:TolA-binding protein
MAKDATTLTRAIIGIIVGAIAITTTVWSVSSAVTAKAQIDEDQTNRITRTEEDLSEQEKRIDKAELAQERLVGINESIAKSLNRIELSQTAQTASQQQFAEDMAIVKTKVENLERAE